MSINLLNRLFHLYSASSSPSPSPQPQLLDSRLIVSLLPGACWLVGYQRLSSCSSFSLCLYRVSCCCHIECCFGYVTYTYPFLAMIHWRLRCSIYTGISRRYQVQNSNLRLNSCRPVALAKNYLVILQHLFN